MAEEQRAGSGMKKHRWRIAGWGAAASLLALPLLAMKFTEDVNWGGYDFFVFGLMLATVGIAFELASRHTKNRLHIFAVALALATAFFLVWANLAVGIIGDEGNPANLMYFGVVAAGVIGSLAARGTPRGMARAMTVTAVAQALVPAIALIAGMAESTALPAMLTVTAIFCAMWLSSAWLFNKSSAEAAGQTQTG
jgi:hypothetical protein